MTIHLNDSEAVGNLPALLERVKQGEEIVFQDGDRAVAVLHAPKPPA